MSRMNNVKRKINFTVYVLKLLLNVWLHLSVYKLRNQCKLSMINSNRAKRTKVTREAWYCLPSNDIRYSVFWHCIWFLLQVLWNKIFNTLFLLFYYLYYVNEHTFIITKSISISEGELIRPWKLTVVDS